MSYGFLYKNAFYPNDENLIVEIDKAALRLYGKLTVLDFNNLGLTDYFYRYTTSYINILKSQLQKYSYILAWSLAYNKKFREEIVFVDYGGGTGLLSLLAKELGVAKVIYIDIWDEAIKNSKKLAHAIDLEADEYLTGDVDILINYFRDNGLKCNAIASYDVIEHIYDIELFFAKLCLIPCNSMTILMASGANDLNPFIRRKLIKQQINMEYNERAPSFGYRTRDSLGSYLNIRKKIIKNYLYKNNLHLSNDIITKLSRNTRGLIESDIYTYIDRYMLTNKFGSTIDHPTNTCEPFNGSWCEKLMNPFMLSNIFKLKGINSNVLSGYYGESEYLGSVHLDSFLNHLINLLKKNGLRLSPYYIIYARKPIDGTCREI